MLYWMFRCTLCLISYTSVSTLPCSTLCTHGDLGVFWQDDAAWYRTQLRCTCQKMTTAAHPLRFSGNLQSSDALSPAFDYNCHLPQCLRAQLATLRTTILWFSQICWSCCHCLIFNRCLICSTWAKMWLQYILWPLLLLLFFFFMHLTIYRLKLQLFLLSLENQSFRHIIILVICICSFLVFSGFR